MLQLRMVTNSYTFIRFQLRIDPFGDDEVARQYMLDAINEDTRANTTHPIAEEEARTADSFRNMSGDANEEDDDFVPLPNQQQHVPVRILKLYAWWLR